MVDKVILNCAVTGSIHVPSQSPHLPITVEEIGNEAIAAAEAGAATVHLHVRDPQNGKPTMDPDLFRELCAKVHAASDVVICITTGGAPTMPPEERMVAVQELKPELASINMGSINFGLYPMMDRIKEYQHDWEQEYLEGTKDLVFKNSFLDQEHIFGIMNACGTKPELECYDVGHLYNAAHWINKGVIKPPFWIQFIMGVHGALLPSVENLVFMKQTADRLFGDDHIFSVLACGRHEYNLGTVGVIMGGSVRIGMEDNLYLGKGTLAESNADMVAKMRGIISSLDFEIATPDEARTILGLKGREATAFTTPAVSGQ
ncbi:3-keto-5-aminohexanoate cleavage protein [Planctomycetota bacterium]